MYVRSYAVFSLLLLRGRAGGLSMRVYRAVDGRREALLA
jgi:hypothetical protein